MRTGVFLPNWIGDVVMATPALRSLRLLADRESGSLVGVMRPYVAEVLAGTRWLDEAVTPDKKSAPAAALRRARLDRVVLLTGSLRTAWLAWRSGAAHRVGVARDGRGMLLTTRLFEPRRGWRRLPVPPIDSYLATAYAAGGPWQPPTLELETTPEDEQAADEVWRRLRLPSDGSVVVLNTGGAYGAAKSWPVEHFAALGRRLASGGRRVLVNCGPAERDTARRIARDARHPGVASLADWPTRGAWSVPIGLSKAVIRRAGLLVTTDSGPRFFGVAFGVPVVSLFGPMGPEATRTHSPLETPLSLALDCQPCGQPTCPLGHHRCMRDLRVDRVHAACLESLAARRAA